MKLIKIVKKALIFWGFTGMVLFVACTDITDAIGDGLVPGSSKLNLEFDTLSIKTYSILSDSLQTSGTESQLLGSISDDVFGNTTAHLFAKFTPAGGFDAGFHEAEFFDSLTLHFAYTGDYSGSENVDLTFRVFELDDNYTDTIDYYSNQRLGYSTMHSETQVITEPDFQEAIDYDPETDNIIPPRLSIKMTESIDHPLVKRLLEVWDSTYLEFDTIIDDLEVYEFDFTGFYQDFPGIYVEVEPVAANGTMLGIKPFSIYSTLSVHRHDTTTVTLDRGGSNERDTLIHVLHEARMGFSTSSGFVFNNIDHEDYADASTNLQDQIINKDTLKGEETVYIQSLAGIRTRVEFPHIQNLLDLGYRIAINKAELVFHSKLDLTDAKYQPPDHLNINVQYEGDSIYVLPDFSYGTNFMGGQLDTTDKAIKDYKYRFRITRYLQEVLDNENEGQIGLYFFANPETGSYRHVSLFGSSPDASNWDKRARLEITYTIIDE